MRHPHTVNKRMFRIKSNVAKLQYSFRFSFDSIVEMRRVQVILFVSMAISASSANVGYKHGYGSSPASGSLNVIQPNFNEQVEKIIQVFRNSPNVHQYTSANTPYLQYGPNSPQFLNDIIQTSILNQGVLNGISNVQDVSAIQIVPTLQTSSNIVEKAPSCNAYSADQFFYGVGPALNSQHRLSEINLINAAKSVATCDLKVAEPTQNVVHVNLVKNEPACATFRQQIYEPAQVIVEAKGVKSPSVSMEAQECTCRRGAEQERIRKILMRQAISAIKKRNLGY